MDNDEKCTTCPIRLVSLNAEGFLTTLSILYEGPDGSARHLMLDLPDKRIKFTDHSQGTVVRDEASQITQVNLPRTMM